jgi:nucleoside-diphosphate-sugar epimerase
MIDAYDLGERISVEVSDSGQALIDHSGTKSRISAIPLGPSVFLLKWLSKLRLLPFAPYHWIMYGRALYFDGSDAKSRLGWEPVYGNVAAIIDSYDWFIANRDELDKSELLSPHRRPVSRGLLKLLKWVL